MARPTAACARLTGMLAWRQAATGTTQVVATCVYTLLAYCLNPVPAATLVDTVGSAALVTVSPKGGVSLNINVNYLNRMPAGGTVLIEAQVGGEPAR